jgi:hypothetical protein
MRKRFFIRLILIVIALTVISLLVYWTRPSRVVDTALAKLARSDTQHFYSAISITNPEASIDILGEKASVDLLVNGQFKREADRRDSLDATLQLTTKTETLTMLVEANARFIGDQAYFQITKAPPSLPLLAELKNIWIELPRGTQQSPAALPEQEDTFVSVKAGPRQELDGTTVKAYQAVATSAAVIRMMDSIAQVLGTHLTAEQIASIQQGVANAENVPIELAITPWSNEIRRISLVTTVPGSNNNMSIELKFTERNKPVEIAVPTDAKKLSDIAGASDEAAPE